MRFPGSWLSVLGLRLFFLGCMHLFPVLVHTSFWQVGPRGLSSGRCWHGAWQEEGRAEPFYRDVYLQWRVPCLAWRGSAHSGASGLRFKSDLSLITAV